MERGWRVGEIAGEVNERKAKEGFAALLAGVDAEAQGGTDDGEEASATEEFNEHQQ